MQIQDETKLTLIRQARLTAREAGVPLYGAQGIALAVTLIEEWSWSRTTREPAALDPDRANPGGI